MTDNVTTPAPEPLVWLDGQPTTRTDAGARRQELMADPEYGKAAAAGDMTKIAELTKLWRIEHGMTPEPQPPANPEDVRASMLDRDAMFDDARLAAWERHIRMDDQMRLEHRRGLVTAQQYEQAQLAKERMLRDGAFRTRVLNGDREAVDEWMRIGRLCSMQIAAPDHDWTKP
jgi:hypothetical protein